MRKLRLYIETSVWNVNAKEEIGDRAEQTGRFFDKSKREGHKIFISPLVIIEIERTQNSVLKTALINSIRSCKPALLDETEEILSLSSNYIAEGIIPEKYTNDAIHIAYTTFYEMDAIVSWNMKHIVKMNTRKLVNHVNLFQGYRNIDLATPEEVFDYE